MLFYVYGVSLSPFQLAPDFFIIYFAWATAMSTLWVQCVSAIVISKAYHEQHWSLQLQISRNIFDWFKFA